MRLLLGGASFVLAMVFVWMAFWAWSVGSIGLMILFGGGALTWCVVIGVVKQGRVG